MTSLVTSQKHWTYVFMSRRVEPIDQLTYELSFV